MLKQVLVFILLLVGVHSIAQRVMVPNLTTFDDRKLHFGFTLGINTMDLGFDYATIDSTSISSNSIYNSYPTLTDSLKSLNYNVDGDLKSLIPGFTVGIVTNLRLSEYFDLRFTPGLSFGNRKLFYNIPIYDATAGSGTVQSYEARSTYLDFPLLIKYKSKRIVNQRPYMIGGVAYRWDISKANDDDLVPMKKNNFFFEIGVGWDSYMQYFRFSTEIKYSLGLNNILGDLPSNFTQLPVYQSAFSRLTSNLLTLSFHFE